MIRGVVRDENDVLPFAGVGLRQLGDSTHFMKGTTTDIKGEFSLSIAEGETYMLEVSFVGYKTFLKVVSASNKLDDLQIILEKDNEQLKGAIVSDTQASFSLNKKTYFFSKDEKLLAKEGQQLIATLPGLHINAIDNSISTLDGKKVLILINGVKSSDSDLRLHTPQEVRSVDYYDVPPLKYMDDAEVVINVKTKPREQGYTFDLLSNVGQLYSNGNFSFSYIRNNQKITANVNAFFNPFRKIRDVESGQYVYSIGGSEREHSFINQSLDWGRQYSSSIAWSLAKEEYLLLQITGNFSFTRQLSNNDSDITLAMGDVVERRLGIIRDSLQTLSPSFDFYLSKQFGDQSLAVNIVYASHVNRQDALSKEMADNTIACFDHINLRSQKHGVISEIDYRFQKQNHSLELGYKGKFSWFSNHAKDSPGGIPLTGLTAQTHFLFAEFSARMENLLFGVTLGGTYNTRSSTTGFSKFSFTPAIQARWNISKRSSLRFDLSSDSTMPDVQQMTDTKFMIINGIYAGGNVSLTSFSTYRSSLKYVFHKGKDLEISLGGRLSYSPDKIYNSFVYQNEFWRYTPLNADFYGDAGPTLAITYNPWKKLRLGLNASAFYQAFREKNSDLFIHNWYCPVSLLARYSHNRFSISYYQMFGGRTLDGVILEGLERISYIHASYSFGRLTLGLRCFFPFLEDKYSNVTTVNNGVFNRSDYNLKTKNHTIGISLSWNFSKGKDLNFEKSLENNIEDAGLYKHSRKK